MLHRSCTLRKLLQQALLNAVPVSYDTTCSASVINSCRHFSNLPKDYASHRVVMPTRAVRKAELSPDQPAADAQASSSTTVSPATPASALQQGAQTATAWMFPWEKRQMDARGSPLRTWEKVYWGVFVTAISLFLFNRLKPNPQEAQIDEDKEAKKMAAARAVLAGRSFTEEEDDPFEGLGPQEIQAYIDKALEGVSQTDPFEGMSPEEINEYTERNGVPTQYQ